MELNETLFKEIVGVRPSTPIYDAGPEQRRHTRVAFGHRARIFPLLESAAGCGAPVLVRDLSRGGVGFQLYDEMSAGDEFVLQLMNQSGAFVHLQCMSQRCEPGGTGLVMFVVGATFELVLNEKQWQPPKVLQRGMTGMNHPEAPAKVQIVVPTMVLAETDTVDASKIRNRLGGGKTKLAERLASSVVAEPGVILPPAALVRARSALFTQEAAPTPEAVQVEVKPAAVVAVAAAASVIVPAGDAAIEAIAATPALAAAASVIAPAGDAAVETIAATPALAAAASVIAPAGDAAVEAIAATPAVAAAASVIAPAGDAAVEAIAATPALAAIEPANRDASPAPMIVETATGTPINTAAVAIDHHADDHSMAAFETQPAIEYADHYAADAVLASLEVPLVDDVDALTPVQELAEHVLTAVNEMAAIVDQALTPVQQIAEHVLATVEVADRDQAAAKAERADQTSIRHVAEQLIAAVEAAPAEHNAFDCKTAAVVDDVLVPMAIETEPALAVVAQNAAADVSPVAAPVILAAAETMRMTAPAAPASVTVATNPQTPQSEASIVVVVVPSSMFGQGQRTITVSAGGMDVTVSIAGDRVVPAVVQPTTMAFESSESTFDLLAQVIDPADAELLTV